MHSSMPDITTCEEDNSTTVTEITLHAELDDYLETPCVPEKKINPVNFLERLLQSNIYPYLSIVAKDVLSVPVSFIPIKGLFSSVGKEFKFERSRLNIDL